MHNTIYPWQQKQWEHIKALADKSRMPHALLLSGSKNLGKRTFALALAARLFCRQPSDLACGKCQTCLLILSETHPDFHLIEPIEKAKVIKIEQVRALVEVLSQTAQQGGPQVVVLHPAEAMNTASANALLKTLEEPQGNVIFLLVSHQPSNVPATIKSRCQHISFSVPDNEIALAWLKQQNISATSTPETLLALAENIPLTALLFVEDDRLSKHNQVVKEFLNIGRAASSPLKAAADLLDIEPEHVFNAIWSVMMDMVRLKPNPMGASIANTDHREGIISVAQPLHLSCLYRFMDELFIYKRRINSQVALNQQLLLEALLIKWRGLRGVS